MSRVSTCNYASKWLVWALLTIIFSSVGHAYVPGMGPEENRPGFYSADRFYENNRSFRVDQASPASEVTPVLAPAKRGRYRYQLNTWPNSIYFTLAPDVEVLGPTFNTFDETSAGKYMAQVFRKLIAAADSQARNHFEHGYVQGADDNFTYFTFLVTALAVPHHESQLMHARRINGKACSQNINGLVDTPKSSRKVLEPLYREAYEILFPNCDSIDEGQETYQLLASGTHDDMTIMQLNPRSHRGAVEPHVSLNLVRTIDYGIRYLYTGKTPLRNPERPIGGYELLRTNYKKLTDGAGNSCADQFAHNPFGRPGTKASSFYNLVGGVWRGQYNRGSYRKACSFFDGSNHSRVFRQTLDSIVVNDNSLFHRYLPEESLERAAFLEIVNNFRAIFTTATEKEQNTNLNRLLARRLIKRHWEGPARREVQLKHSYILREGQTPVHGPWSKRRLRCGHLEPYQGETAVAVQDVVSLRAPGGKRDWAIVHVPEFAPFIKRYSVDSWVTPAKGVNLRSDTRVHADTFIRKAENNERFEYLRREKVKGEIWYWGKDEKGYEIAVHSSVGEVIDEKKAAPESCNTHEFFVPVDQLRVVYETGQNYMAQIIGDGRAFVRGAMNSGAEAIVTVAKERDEPFKLVVTGHDTDAAGRKWYVVQTGDEERPQGYIFHSRLEFLHHVE